MRSFFFANFEVIQMATAAFSGLLWKYSPSYSLLFAGAMVSFLFHTRLVVLENGAKSSKSQQELAICALEEKVANIENQLQLMKRRLVPSSSPSTESEFVKIQPSSGLSPKQGEISSWTALQTQEWVESVLKVNTYSHLFENVDGTALLDMLLDHEHGFSFGDKCFFMGMDREACKVLENASLELLKE